MSKAESSRLILDVTTPICKRIWPCSLYERDRVKSLPQFPFLPVSGSLKSNPSFICRRASKHGTCIGFLKGGGEPGAHRHLIKCLVTASDHRPKVVIKMSPSRYACFYHVRRWCLRGQYVYFPNYNKWVCFISLLDNRFPLIQFYNQSKIKSFDV